MIDNYDFEDEYVWGLVDGPDAASWPCPFPSEDLDALSTKYDSELRFMA